jgi:hypothetical protein
MKGATRPTYSAAYLGWGRPVEAALRWLSAGGSGARVLREERGSTVAVRGEVGSRSGLFIGAGRRFGGKNLPGDLAGGSTWGLTTGLEWRRDELLVQAR